MAPRKCRANRAPLSARGLATRSGKLAPIQGLPENLSEDLSEDLAEDLSEDLAEDQKRREVPPIWGLPLYREYG